jgi:hypothetical protein
VDRLKVLKVVNKAGTTTATAFADKLDSTHRAERN